MKKFLSAPAAVLVLMLLPPCPGYSVQKTAESKIFVDYSEMRRYVGELYREEKFDEAARVLAEHLDRFPDHVRANAYNLALMRTRLEEYDGAVRALLFALEKGVWFGKYDFTAPPWNPLRGLKEFSLFEARNTRMMKEAAKTATPRLEVRVPSGFDRDRTYPLFIALHGGGENIRIFRPNWTSPLLEEEFVVAYPQSSQLIAADGYNWTEDLETTLREIQEAFRRVAAEYPIDPGQVLVGGFSSGGVAALETVLSNIFPVRGFVVLCPAKPEGFTVERVRAADERGVTGTLLTTEMDGRLDQQREMNGIMKSAGMACEFLVLPDIGHWYPEDMPARLDAAITRIREGESGDDPGPFDEDRGKSSKGEID